MDDRQNELVDRTYPTRAHETIGLGEPSGLADCEVKVIGKLVQSLASAIGRAW